MAIANVGNRGSISTAPAATSVGVAMPAGGSVVVGNHLILFIVCDNAGVAGASPFGSFVVNDPRGNYWVVEQSVTRSAAGVANDGTSLLIAFCHVQYPYTNGDTITASWSVSAANRIATVHEFSGVRKVTYAANGPVTANSSGTAISSGSVNPSASGQLVIAATGFENGGSTISNDADGVDGAWAATTTVSIGAGATGQMLGYSYKIVSGVTSQQWNVTGGSASDWVTIGFALAAETAAAPTWVPGNPNYSCIAGFEGLPTASTTVPVDTGTEYFFEHVLFPQSVGTQEYRANAAFTDPGTRQMKTVAFDLFLTGNETVVDEITTVVLPIRRADLFNGASTSAGTALAALSAQGGAYVIQDGSGGSPDYTQVWFDPTVLTTDYARSRVVRVGVRFKAWKDDSSPAIPGEGLRVHWYDTSFGTGVIHGSWLVYEYQRNAQIMTRWLGETNVVPRGGAFTTDPSWRAPFTVTDLSHMDAADQSVSLLIEARPGYDLLQTTTYLDFIEMVVEVVPERRIGAVNRLVTNTGAFVAPYTNTTSLRMFYVYDTAQQVILTDSNYTLGLREALPPSPSDQYHVDPDGAIAIADAESIGPALQLKAVTVPRPTLEPIPTLTRGVLSGGVLTGEATDFDQYILGACGLDFNVVGLYGSFWNAFDGLGREVLLQIYSPVVLDQEIKVDGTQTYDRVKMLVKPDPLTTDPLTISIRQPIGVILATASISVAQALAGEPAGEGWYEISVPLSVSITPTAGSAYIFAASVTTSTRPWRWAAARTLNGAYQYGYYAGGAIASSRVNDYAGVLECTLAVPSLSLGSSSVELLRPTCTLATLELPVLTISNGALYDRLVIERTINGGLTWDVVGIELGGVTSFTDYAPPWDMPSISYRVTGYRDSDRRAVTSSTVAWGGAPASSPGAAFGLVDLETGLIAAYAPVADSALDVTWSPLDPVSTVALHGVDYQVALRSPEYRGLAVSVTVLVDHFAVCETGNTAFDVYGEYIAPGGASFSPTPFTYLLLALERSERLVLQLPGGHTRFVSLDLGGLTIRTQNGVYLAELNLTDVTPPNSDPYAEEA